MTRLPDGLRWSCRGTGACCRSGFSLGPVEPEIVETLREADIGRLWEPAADGYLDLRTGPDGAVHPFLATRDGACVFLRPDDLCAVHALLGEQAKPGFCREFPYNVSTDPRGTVVVVRPTCVGFGASSVDGPTPADIDAVVGLRRMVPPRHFAPPTVEVAPGLTVGLDTWMAWEPEVLDALSAAEPEPLVRAARGALSHLAGESWSPAPRPEQARAGRIALLTVLGRMMEQVLAQEGGAPHQVAFARGRADDLAHALRAVDEPLPALDADARAYSALLARSFVLSKQFAAWGGVADGIGLWLLGLEVARRSAARHSEAPLSAAALGPHCASWAKFEAITPISRLLQRARVALRDLFLHT